MLASSREVVRAIILSGFERGLTEAKSGEEPPATGLKPL